MTVQQAGSLKYVDTVEARRNKQRLKPNDVDQSLQPDFLAEPSSASRDSKGTNSGMQTAVGCGLFSGNYESMRPFVVKDNLAVFMYPSSTC